METNIWNKPVDERVVRVLAEEVDNLKRINLSTIRLYQKDVSVIIRRRVTGSNSKPYYRLEESLTLLLSDGTDLIIPEGFIWDLSSVPRLLWGILPPDGDFELASLIHDYLYSTKIRSRKFADDEMLKWSKGTSGTDRKWSIRNFDNQLRYVTVRAFGWLVWDGWIN